MPEAFLIFLIVVMIVLFLVVNRAKNTTSQAAPAFSRNNTENSPQKIYTSRSFLLTKCESSFYGVLKLATDGRFAICPKVRLSDLIRCTSGNPGDSNRINQKHIDFVLCEKDSMKIVCALELNDRSHLEGSRKKRDELVSSALDEAKIKFLPIRAAAEYSVQDLRNAIFSERNPERPESPEQPRKLARTSSNIKSLIHAEGSPAPGFG